jgi:L-lactate permease
LTTSASTPAAVTAAPAPYAAVFTLNWLSASGTACFLATLVTALLLGVKPRQVVGIYRATFAQLSFDATTANSPANGHIRYACRARILND